MKLARWGLGSGGGWVILLLGGGLLYRATIAFWMYPGFDEAYYYLYTLYPDWSYFDHPPLVAILTAIGPWLTGVVSQFTLRIGTLVLYTGTLGLLYATSVRLFSAQTGLLTLAIATLIPFFQVAFGTFNLPDVPLMFFWTATLYWAGEEFFRRTPAYQPSYRLAIICVMVGLACLGKYHGFVLGAGLVGFCLCQSRYRSALISPWTAIGAGLFLLTLSPLLIWNAQHDWVSFRFQSARTVPTRGFSGWGVLVTFLVEVAYLFPTFGFPLWWVSAKATIATLLPQSLPFSVKGDLPQKRSLILWVSLPLMLGFTLMGGYQQVLPSWPMPGLWGATLLLGQQAALWQKQSERRIRRWLLGSGVAIVALVSLALTYVVSGMPLPQTNGYVLQEGIWTVQPPPSTPPILEMQRPTESLATIDYAVREASSQLFDVQQLRQGFARSPTLMAALQSSSFVFTNYYFVGGQIAMALVPLSGKPITCFDSDLRGFAFWSKPDQWLGQDALYITSEYFQRPEDLRVKYGEYFASIERIGQVPIRRGKAVVQVFEVYQAKRLLKPYPRPY